MGARWQETNLRLTRRAKPQAAIKNGSLKPIKLGSLGMRQHMKTGTTRTITRWVFLLFCMTALAMMAAAEDPVWPRQITKPGGKLVLYQPQVDDWTSFP